MQVFHSNNEIIFSKLLMYQMTSSKRILHSSPIILTVAPSLEYPCGQEPFIPFLLSLLRVSTLFSILPYFSTTEFDLLWPYSLKSANGITARNVGWGRQEL